MNDEERPAKDAEYQMVMPLTCVTSNGGEFDDGAFIAGTRYAQLENILSHRWLQGHAHYVEPGLVKQLDLLAMHHGFTMTATPWEEHPDEWVRVDFERATLEALGADPEEDA